VQLYLDAGAGGRFHHVIQRLWLYDDLALTMTLYLKRSGQLPSQMRVLSVSELNTRIRASGSRSLQAFQVKTQGMNPDALVYTVQAHNARAIVPVQSSNTSVSMTCTYGDYGYRLAENALGSLYVATLLSSEKAVARRAQWRMDDAFYD
jgi:hypothetical protein